jgi:uracil-DNA glycosylase
VTDICIIGEAYGESEDREKAPFVGAAGYELTKMLAEAGIARANCFLTNVFNIRPPGNKVEWFTGPKAEALSGYPALVKGKFVHARFAPELSRLSEELLREDPNLVIALGNTAMWALLGKTAISKYRGTTALSTHTAGGFKVLPTYHPAAIFRQWELRPIAVIDLAKARRESLFPEIRRPEVTMYVPETTEELHSLIREHLAPAERLAVDIETSGNQITCIGFAPNRYQAIVVPFVDGRRVGRNYWNRQEDEIAAWKAIAGLLMEPTPKKTFQNGMYDIAFLWRAQGIAVMGAEDDTMLLHHALQPESLKGLGFLGSVYTDHGAWKTEHREDTIKKDA